MLRTVPTYVSCGIKDKGVLCMEKMGVSSARVRVLPVLNRFDSVTSRCRRVVFCCRSNVRRVMTGLRVLGGRFGGGRREGPVRGVGDHMGSLSDVVSGVGQGNVPLAAGTVGHRVGSVTNIEIVYPFVSSMCRITGVLIGRTSIRVIAVGSCVGGPGRGNCEDLRVVILISICFSSRGSGIPVRVRFHAVTVGF